MPTAAPAFVPTFINFDDDGDEDFGQFKFAATPAPSPPPPRKPPFNQRQLQEAAETEEDDDWGDFVESTAESYSFRSPGAAPPAQISSSFTSCTPVSAFFDPLPAFKTVSPDPAPARSVSLPSGETRWQKRAGALPLSLFGEEEEEDGGGEEPSNSPESGFAVLEAGEFGTVKTGGGTGVSSAHSGGLKDLIAALYGQGNKVDPAVVGNSRDNGAGSNVHTDNVMNCSFADGDIDEENELDDNDWEFKDALSIPQAGDSAMWETSCNEILKFDGEKSENKLVTNLISCGVSDEWDWAKASTQSTSVIRNDFRSSDNGCDSHVLNTHRNLKQPNIWNVSNGQDTSITNGNISLDDDLWEFNDASSNIRTVNDSYNPENIGQELIELEDSFMSASSNEDQDFGASFVVVDGCRNLSNSTDNVSKEVKFFPPAVLSDLVSNMHSESYNAASVTEFIAPSGRSPTVPCAMLKKTDSVKLLYDDLSNDVQNDLECTFFVNFYSGLKQKSYTLALYHINYLKLMKADERVVPNGKPKETYSDVEIKAILLKLGVTEIGSDSAEKCQPNELSVIEFVEALKKPGLRGFNLEYDLSDKILMAAKDLSSAMWIFEHASHVLDILMVASQEEQRTYIGSWVRMVSACEQELQHGALIWSQALHANAQMELLSISQGQQYFLALGEIYRVVEIFNASVRLYKGWILLNTADSEKLLTHIKKSTDAWAGSTLKQALEIISESYSELNKVTNELLESIKFISELSENTLHNYLSRSGRICRLSLLPLELHRELKGVLWDGELYFTKLANLWANRISDVAPQMPPIIVCR